MKKQVTFNEGFNQIKEFPRIPADEKSTLWISKVEISMFRKEVQAENLLDQARSLVKKTILEMNSQTNTDPDEEEVNKQVDSIMLRGIGDVLVFLSDHGVSLMAPGDEKSKHTEAATSVTTNGEQQVRNMVRHKLVLEQTETFLSKEELENQLNEVMKLSRSEILEFLQQESSKHEESHTYPQSDTVSFNFADLPKDFNWVSNSTGYWSELPVVIREAATELGYNQLSWDNTDPQDIFSKVWEELSAREQKAASTLGYTSSQWNMEGEAIGSFSREEKVFSKKQRATIDEEDKRTSKIESYDDGRSNDVSYSDDSDDETAGQIYEKPDTTPCHPMKDSFVAEEDKFLANFLADTNDEAQVKTSIVTKKNLFAAEEDEFLANFFGKDFESGERAAGIADDQREGDSVSRGFMEDDIPNRENKEIREKQLKNIILSKSGKTLKLIDEGEGKGTVLEESVSLESRDILQRSFNTVISSISGSDEMSYDKYTEESKAFIENDNIEQLEATLRPKRRVKLVVFLSQSLPALLLVAFAVYKVISKN